jgi:DnaJ-class molecular chaperone
MSDALQYICPYCSGRGATARPSFETVTCSSCDGKGHIATLENWDRGYWSAETCGPCGGKGTTQLERVYTCGQCGGGGRVSKEVRDDFDMRMYKRKPFD